MAVKLLYYFIFTFLGIFLFLMVQEPYLIEKPKAQENQANIKLFMATNYSIDKQGVNSVIKAQRAYRYDTYDVFEHITMERLKEPGFLEEVQANKGRLEGSELMLSGDVEYQNSDNVDFTSQEVHYNLDTKVARSDEAFVLKDKKTVVHGNALIYESKEGKIYAQNIKSTSKVDEK